MTNQEVSERFTVIWAGGEILPGYELQMHPAYQEPPVRALRPLRRARPKLSEKLRKYTAAQREAVRAMRQDGLHIQQIADLTGYPISTVYNFLTK